MSLMNGFGDQDKLKSKVENSSYEVKNKVVLVPIESITENDSNFYTTDDIDKLAEAIELSGLRHPISITSDKKIISGHRRFLAFKALNKTEIPCIIEEFENEMLEEIALITANSQRKKSSEDVKKEIDRLTELYKELQKSGRKFSGGIRKQVAEDLGLSLRTVDRKRAEIKEVPVKSPEQIELEKTNKITESNIQSYVDELDTNANYKVGYKENMSGKGQIVISFDNEVSKNMILEFFGVDIDE